MGFQIIKPNTNINFIGIRRIAYIISLTVILAGLGSLLVKGGPQYGIDFAGGMIVQIKFDQQVDVDQLKSALGDTDLPGLVVQSFGQEDDYEFLVRTSASDIPSDTVRKRVSDALSSDLPGLGFEVQRLEMVGPKVGSDLRSKALEAVFYAVLIIAIYISGRFEQRWFAAIAMAAGLATGIYLLKLLGIPMAWLILAAMLITLGLCWFLKLSFALGAVIALVHDVLITVGVFSVLGKEFDLTTIAAVLTIIGYSLNDTIIVFDRIRENMKGRAREDFAATINASINQTLSRTILTSGTTLLVILCLWMFGGGVIHDFALALLVGIGTGTFSSIFVAAPILLSFGPGSSLDERKEVEATS
ncbi:protein translocase subunit SecF [Desulfocurvibacter africanus]|uniref:Protein-export membrane protein SecF n=1 Tax=Desulfocurvibacter africanus subsp. africanus str. Walvis Bay TaxID=690850 RepID=F3Z2W1_DESAF|nr:protein translocase subunit SecF [Desulfocurvibacter africanus]EGJ51369.1 protein-export membrane protein SecF [Desulfocurvibacter africanus subsp. africanus str. Walvis Bay]